MEPQVFQAPDRPPEIMTFALDNEKHFVQVPLVTGPRTLAKELIRIRLAKLAAPFTRVLPSEVAQYSQVLRWLLDV